MDSRSVGPDDERVHLPVSAPPTNHGHTVAAWALVGLVILGGVVMALAVILAETWLFAVGAGVAVVGLVVGRVLKMLGFGQTGEPGTVTRPKGTASAAS